ncbi:MAG: carbon storage regulator [Chloroflexi bacterium]|nr:carbon storage regulator [Chloroflexota bacterium]
MLVLSRKATETIVVDDAIEVTVLEILGDRVKIGINAPRDVPIVRQELLHQARGNHRDAVPPAESPPATTERDA